jgi:hypothetical protein
MTPRALDWRSVRPKLRKIGELLDTLRGFGALGLLAVSSGFGRVGPAWRVDGGKIVSLTV